MTRPSASHLGVWHLGVWTRLRLLTAGLAFAAALGILTGCDDAPGLAPPNAPPTVFDLQYAPDSVNGADVVIEDSVAQIPVDVLVQAQDPDGTVDRVVFTLEPAAFPQAAFADTLQQLTETQYGLRLSLGLPAFIDETYTLRVYAVDDDSLAGNQAIGRLRYVPPAE